MSKKSTKTKEKKYWLDSPQNIRKFILCFYALCGLVLVADLIYSVFFHKHSSFDKELLMHYIDILPTFYGVYGFVACVALVYLSKLMRGWNGKRILMRDEDYWEK